MGILDIKLRKGRINRKLMAFVGGLALVLTGLGCVRSVQPEERRDGQLKMITVHIDGFKKSESGAV
jgi:hypothetical protein